MAINVNSGIIQKVNYNGNPMKTVIVNGALMLLTADACFGWNNGDPDYDDKSYISIENSGYDYSGNYVMYNNKTTVVVKVTVPSSITIKKISVESANSGTVSLYINNTAIMTGQSIVSPVVWTGSSSGGGLVTLRMEKTKNGKGFLRLNINDAPVVFW